MSILNPENSLNQGISKLFDSIMLNAIWLLCCMPLFLLIYFVLLTETWLLLLLSCVAVVLAGPATAAFYYTMNKTIRHDRGYVWEQFWHSFRSSFKQSVIIAEILTLVALFILYDSSIMLQLANAGVSFGSLYVVFWIFLALEIMWASYLFPYVARFENNVRTIMKNAALMAISYLPRTFLLFALFAGMLYLITLLPILICVLPAAYTYVKVLLLEKIFRNFMSADDLAREDEANQEYYSD
jgi:uncharacterized membrane protein YesL